MTAEGAVPHSPRNHLVELARIAVETYVCEQRIIDPPHPLSAEQQQRRGVFVTLLLGDDMRGSVGTLRPEKPNLATEVISNAIAAAVRDPRFSPVLIRHLTELRYVIDVIETIEPCTAQSELDPARYGIFVRWGRNVGVVLPHTAGVDDAAAQRAMALRKAGIAPDEPYEIQCFTVRRLI